MKRVARLRIRTEKSLHILSFLVLWIFVQLIHEATSQFEDTGVKYRSCDIEVLDDANTIINSTLTEIKKVVSPRKASASDHDGGSVVEQVTYQHLETLTLVISVECTRYILDLKLNKLLLSPGYKESLIGKNDQEIKDVDVGKSSCFYIGVVRDFPGSLAAVSTCSGVTGMFRIGGETFEIWLEEGESVEGCVSCKHRVSKGSDNPSNTQHRCGTTGSSTTFNTRRKRAALESYPQDLDKQIRMVEVYVVNDFYQYQNFSNNEGDTFRRMKDLVNWASALYEPLDIYLVLVGAEIWTDQEKIGVDLTSSNKFLDDFTTYGNQQIKQHRDVALLITSKGPFESGIVGLANLGKACKQYLAYCFVCDTSKAQGHTIDTVAHEIGHTLGLIHTTGFNSGNCPCDVDSEICIMDAVTIGDKYPTEWGSCSTKALTSNENKETFYCLYDKPDTLYDSSAVCGNGLVEAGEQCDCGKAPNSECNSQCCSATTCQLINNAQCAYGRCCDVGTCKFKAAYTECRSALGDCDLSEYCSGSDALCPTDVYKSYNTKCTLNNIESYCYDGQCKTINDYCTSMLPELNTDGNTVGAAPVDCLKQNNVRGDWRGNCGPTGGIPALTNFVACANQDDAQCGLLQCVTSFNGVFPGNLANVSEITVNGQQVKCLSAMAGLTGPRYNYVPNGVPCGTDMVCSNQKCVSLTSFKSCDSPCANQGVCNSLGQCHCMEGFGGDNCSLVGEGGSPHSNPIAFNEAVSHTSAASTSEASTTTTTTTAPATPAVTNNNNNDNKSNDDNGSLSNIEELLIVILIPSGTMVVGVALFCLCYCLLSGSQSNKPTG